MKRLLIDLGNSRLKWAVAEGDRLVTAPESLALQGTPLTERLAQRWRHLPPPDQIAVSSVAGPEADNALARCCAERWGITPRFLRSTARARGVVNAYPDPARLGIDRWAALIAAHTRWPGETLCVADCGTAVTFDALEGNGRHLGGLILPGLTMMQHALSAGTAGASPGPSPLPDQDAWLGRSTDEGILLGCIGAITAILERNAARLGKQTKSEVRCLLTGGEASRLLPYLSERWQHSPALVLEGTGILAENETGVDDGP